MRCRPEFGGGFSLEVNHVSDYVRATQLRTATAADAESLAAVAERTFRDTFGDDNAPDDIEAYVRDSFSLARVRAELADDANTFLLAFTDGEEQPDGYAKLRIGTTDPSVSGADPVELQRLYVDRSAIGHGVGAALMRGHRGMPRFPPSRLVRRLPAWPRHVLARLRLRAGIRQTLTIPEVGVLAPIPKTPPGFGTL